MLIDVVTRKQQHFIANYIQRRRTAAQVTRITRIRAHPTYTLSAVYTYINSRQGAQEFDTYNYQDDIARDYQGRCSSDTHKQRAVQNTIKHIDATYLAIEPHEHLSVYIEQIDRKAKAHTRTQRDKVNHYQQTGSFLYLHLRLDSKVETKNIYYKYNYQQQYLSVLQNI